MSASIPMYPPNTNIQCIDKADRIYLKCVRDFRIYVYGIEHWCDHLYKNMLVKCEKESNNQIVPLKR